MACGICGKAFGPKTDWTIRESWLKAGGWGDIDPKAVVHPACDKQEIGRLNTGKVKLSDLWTKIEKA